MNTTKNVSAASEAEAESAETARQNHSASLLKRLHQSFAAIKIHINQVDSQAMMACGIFFMVAALFLSVIDACRHAYDFSDEGLYFLAISSPKLHIWSVTKFGSFYHPFYELLGKNVFLLRIVDAIFRYILSFLLVWLILSEKICNLDKKHLAWAVVAGIATISFMSNMHYPWWLATPSYNTLNFEGLLVCMIGVVLTTQSPKKYFGLIVAGIGCTLCFLAKPPSAAVLLFCLSCYFFPNSKEN